MKTGLSRVRVASVGATALGLILSNAAIAQTDRVLPPGADATALPQTVQPGAAPAPSNAAANGEQVDGASLADIVVTGTSIRGISAVGSAAISLGREQLLATGRNTPVDVLRELPQIQGLGFDEGPRVAQNGGGNIQRGSTVNLRGLGSNATLLLVDGHRVAPTGNVFSFTDANQLPVAAIERIDVIADGASAIYGSDAVAGVVNYITRKKFDGVEMSLRGTTTKGYDQWGGSVLVGKSWNFGGREGGIVVAYDHDERDEMLNSASPYLRQDLTRFGGADNRIRTNNATASAPGNIVVPRATNNTTLPSAGRFDYYGLPAGTSGVGVTGPQLRLNQPNLADTADFASYLPKTKRDQLSINVRQSLTDWLSANYLFVYNHRSSELYNYPQSGVRTLPATSPYYVQGVPGVAAGAPQTVVFSLFKDVGRGVQYVSDDSYQHVGSIEARLPGDWRAEAIVNWSRDKNCANCQPALSGNINVNALQAALNNGTYNPFASTPAPASVLQAILPSAFDRNESNLYQYTGRLDGPLFHLPGGDVKLAIGAEYLRLNQYRSSIGVQATSDVPYAFARRDIKAVYAEIFIPLFGADNARPLLNKLSIDLAIRRETYSDAGTTTNPKVGVAWTVAEGFTLRGAYGTSFRAPNLIENNPQFFSRVGLSTIANAAGDPAIPTFNTATGTSNVVQVSGSNAELTPEKARNYSFGVDFQPTFLSGLRGSIGYYNIRYTNQIIGLQTFSGTFLASAANRALYAPYIIVAPQPATCVPGQPSTYNPLYLAPLSRPSAVPPDQSQFCTASAIIVSQNTNAATNVQDGIDLQANYQFETGASRWIVGGNFTKILKNKLQIVKGGTSFDARDLINYPVSIRGRGSITWMLGGLTVSPAANYIGSYTNNLPITVNGVTRPIAKVKSWTTIDLTLDYKFDKLFTFGEGLRASLVVRNLFDRDPPTVLSANGNAFDPQNANPLGRIGTLTITKAF